MAKVMLRHNGEQILFYLAKKDLEEPIASVEFSDEAKWGGEIELRNGEVWFIEPGPKKIPAEVNARRIRGQE